FRYDYIFAFCLEETFIRVPSPESKDFRLPTSVGPEKERLALHILHSALTLVPEHVESRSLYHPERPGLAQGTIQLWVDLFPSDVAIPRPVDITPRRPSKYSLRICIYNVYEVPLQETNIAGDHMSDVYLKGWLQGTENVQKTDIHYRCLDGEANFNWRMVFPFDFLEAEQMMVVTKKMSLLSSKEAQETRPPHLTLQLWDNDLILSDDYLSEMTVDLCRLPKPAKSLDKVSLARGFPTGSNGRITSDGTSTTLLMTPDGDEQIYLNLFEVKRVYGYFPFCRVGESGALELAGKLEAEMEVIPEEEVKSRPAGQGRDQPNANPNLPDPK
ncbi:UNVERIFIED_CONTAM: hypothetical protein GTU68_054722, partial [Idotea baltica]|nr:hypothetical protein [Idotea baltica]